MTLDSTATITTHGSELNAFLNKILSDFCAKESVKMPFAINEKFLCDPSRFRDLQKSAEEEMAGLEWDLNSPLLNAHLIPKNYPTLPKIVFLSEGNKSQLMQFLLLKFAFTIVHRKYIDFETENEQKIAEEWLLKMLNILAVKIVSNDSIIHRKTLESIEFFIDYKENNKTPDDVKRIGYKTGHSLSVNSAINSLNLSNLSWRNQQAAKQFNKVQKSSKQPKHQAINRTHELLWKKPNTKTNRSHSTKGKKEKVQQKSAEDPERETFKLVNELDDQSIKVDEEKQRKVQKEDDKDVNGRKKSDEVRKTKKNNVEQGKEPLAKQVAQEIKQGKLTRITQKWVLSTSWNSVL